MDWRDGALMAAGFIGSGVAIVHGVLVQRLMVTPFVTVFRDDKRMSLAAKRLTPILLHESTVVWFLGGLALIAAALWFDASARLAVALCVGALYAYGALGNLWGTRGRHPGWLLYALSVALIVFGVSK